jgi:hypothetical protein
MEDSEEMLEVMGIPSLDLENLNLTSSAPPQYYEMIRGYVNLLDML